MGSKSQSVTVGFRYFLGLHFGISHGPVDRLIKVLVGDRVAWDIGTAITGPIDINAPELFGGDKSEGGTVGTLDVMMGEHTQAANAYLTLVQGAIQPAYRGMFGAVFRGPSGYSGHSGFPIPNPTLGQTVSGASNPGGQVSAINPYVKPWAFDVERTLKGWKRLSLVIPAELEDQQSDDATSDAGSGSDALSDDLPSDQLSSDESSEGLPPYEFPITVVNRDPWYPETCRIQICAPVEGTPDHVQVMFLIDNSRAMDVEAQQTQAIVITAALNKLQQLAGNGVKVDFLFAAMQHFTDSYGEENALPSQIQSSIDALNADPGGFVFVFRCDWTAGWSTAGQFFRDLDTGTQVTISPVPADGVAPAPRRLIFFCTGDGPGDQPPPPIGRDAEQVFEDTLALPEVQDFINREGDFAGEYAVDILPFVYGSSAPFYASAFQNTDLGTQNLPFGVDPNTIANLILGEGADTTDAVFAMNPAHIIYQCLTDPEWGLGYPDSLIDEPSFTNAADTFFGEGLGLCLLWTQQSEIGDFVQQVLDHCGAFLYTSPATGKFVLKPIRADYVADELPLYNEDHIKAVESFERPSLGETVNEITVVYIDRCDTHKPAPITVQDLGNIAAQGAIVNQTRQYPGIPTAELAGRIAERDLLTAATPLAKIRIRTNRATWRLAPGEVCRIGWVKLSLVSVVFRVLAVDYGTPLSGELVIDLAEDVFGLPDSVYSVQQPSLFVPPDRTPPVIVIQDVIEAPYYDVARELSEVELAGVDADAARIFTLAAVDNGLASTYSVYSQVSESGYNRVGDGVFMATAVTDGAVSQSQTTIPYRSEVQLSKAAIGQRVMIGTGRLAEFCELVSIDATNDRIEVIRAILDTTPQEHADGTRIFFDAGSFGSDPTERTTGDDIDIKLTSITGAGESPIGNATPMNIIPDQRFFRPLPPGNVTINGQAYPTAVEAITGDPLAVAWAHRDRELQTADFIPQTDGDIGPEAETTYTVEVYDDTLGDSSDALLDIETGITGTSAAMSIPYETRLRVEIASVRDGIESWQRQIRIFEYTSDGTSTEDGDGRADEDDNLRQEE